MRGFSVFGKVTHLKFSGLLVDPKETLFELIFQGPILNILQIAVLFPVAFNDLIKIGDFLFEFLNLTAIIFYGTFHFLELKVNLGDFLFEDFNLVLPFCNDLLHRLVLLSEVIVFLFEGLIKSLQILKTILELY